MLRRYHLRSAPLAMLMTIVKTKIRIVISRTKPQFPLHVIPVGAWAGKSPATSSWQASASDRQLYKLTPWPLSVFPVCTWAGIQLCPCFGPASSSPSSDSIGGPEALVLIFQGAVFFSVITVCLYGHKCWLQIHPPIPTSCLPLAGPCHSFTNFVFIEVLPLFRYTVTTAI